MRTVFNAAIAATAILSAMSFATGNTDCAILLAGAAAAALLARRSLRRRPYCKFIVAD